MHFVKEIFFTKKQCMKKNNKHEYNNTGGKCTEESLCNIIMCAIRAATIK